MIRLAAIFVLLSAGPAFAEPPKTVVCIDGVCQMVPMTVANINGVATMVPVVPAKTVQAVMSPLSPVTSRYAVIAQRMPVGHTHTCAAGHSWDHSVTADHNCPVCGQYQNRQDVPARMVNIGIVGTQSATPTSAYTMPSSGCVNGQCPTPTRVIYR